MVAQAITSGERICSSMNPLKSSPAMPAGIVPE